MFDFEERLEAKRSRERAAQEKTRKIESDTDNAAIALNKSVQDFSNNNSLGMSVSQAGRIITITHQNGSKMQIIVHSGPKYEYEIHRLKRQGFTSPQTTPTPVKVERPVEIVDAILDWAYAQ